MSYGIDFMYFSPDCSDILYLLPEALEGANKDLAESWTIVEKYEISFAPKKENRFALFKFLAIFTK